MNMSSEFLSHLLLPLFHLQVLNVGKDLKPGACPPQSPNKPNPLHIVGDPMWNSDGNIYHLATSLWEVAVETVKQTHEGRAPHVVIPKAWLNSVWYSRLFRFVFEWMGVQSSAHKRYKRFCLDGDVMTIQASQPFRKSIVRPARVIMHEACNMTDRLRSPGMTPFPVLIYNRPEGLRRSRQLEGLDALERYLRRFKIPYYSTVIPADPCEQV